MRNFIFILSTIFGMVGTLAQEYYPEGTKWTEIRLDTLKYDSWYSKVGDEWVPNYEMVEYYVKGEIKNNCWVGEGFPDYFQCIYSDGPTWSDSLTFLVMESKYGAQATIPLFEEDMLMLIPGTAYIFGKWETGQTLGFRTILGANILSIPAVGYGSYGTIQEIKEGYWGGTHSLKCAYLDNGRQVIHGIGVTAWNGETCLLGAIIDGIYEPQYYRSLLVHFERNGEVLYDVWPKPSDPEGIKGVSGRPTPDPSRQVEENGGGVYDLQGRRLQKAPEKGVYILDGKILVK